jgi:hypothetical protein
MQAHEQIELLISEEVERLIEDRHILSEDLQKTIHHAETTGEKFINPSTCRSLASFRPGRVTFWVEYTKSDEAYQIHTAYSHRMEMKRGRGL